MRRQGVGCIILGVKISVMNTLERKHNERHRSNRKVVPKGEEKERNAHRGGHPRKSAPQRKPIDETGKAPSHKQGKAQRTVPKGTLGRLACNAGC